MTDNNSYTVHRDESHRRNPELLREYERLGPRYEAIAEVLRARQEMGLTQADLAEAVGTTRSVISRLESGRHSPTLDTLTQVAEALGCSLEVRFVRKSPESP